MFVQLSCVGGKIIRVQQSTRKRKKKQKRTWKYITIPIGGGEQPYSIARGYSYDANAIPRARLNGWHFHRAFSFTSYRREINQFCMFDVSIVSVKYSGVSRCAAPFRVPPPPNDIQRERRVDSEARFQCDTQSTMKHSQCYKRFAGVGIRVKSQPAAMKRRRSVLIRFPSKTLLPKYFTMGGGVLHAWRGKVRALACLA